MNKNLERNKGLNKLNEIGEILINYSFKDNPNLSFYGGSSGVIFSLMHLAHSLDNSIYYDKAFDLLVDLINKMESTPLSYTFADGISGIGWMINYLIDQDMIEIDSDDLLYNIDSNLKNYCASLDFDSSTNLDFLHGIQGIAFYFLNRENSINTLDLILTHIEKQAILEPDGAIKWIFINNHYKTASYNLSLSHGISSVIAILTCYLEKGLFEKRVNILLKGAVRFLLKHQQDYKKYNSYFPSVIPLEKDNISNTKEPSRLAWCYGDIGIAYQLHNTGLVIGDSNLINFSIEVLKHNTTRKEQNDHLIKDACLCHGSAGIAIIYKLLFDKTKIDLFKETSEYWLNQTLEYSMFPDGLAGYKAYHSPNYKNDNSFLEGVAGIVLTLNSVFEDIDYPWYKSLLL